jgi:hypothetical protein
MKLETIYNDLVDIMNHEYDFTKMIKLKDKLEQAIRENTCYKTTSKTRVNAIKRIASKLESRPALMGYGIYKDYKCITDSYHLVAIHEENMPLKLVTTDKELKDKVGRENCINATYPNMEHIINFDKQYYNEITLDYDDIMQYYKLHKKNAKDEPYEINGQYYNIIYLKNVIDVLGTDLTIYQSKDYFRPMYLINKDNELGLVLGIRKY